MVEGEDPCLPRQQARSLSHLSLAGVRTESNLASQIATSADTPGVPEMQRMKGDLSYKYVETGRGGKVLISAANPETLKAVHEFLRFQIEVHKTGDAEAVQK